MCTSVRVLPFFIPSILSFLFPLSFFLCLFHYSFLRFFPSFNLFPSPSFVVPPCPLSVSLFICLRFRKPFVISHFVPPNGLPSVKQPKHTSHIPLWTKVKMHGSLPTRPLYAFIIWCLDKETALNKDEYGFW